MLQKALQSRDFTQAKTLSESGEKLPSDIQDYNKTNIFDTIIREKAFDFVDHFISDGTIELDIYEYDSFDKSIFASIAKHLSDDQESLDFLKAFIPKVESLNDELEGKSLLSYALENEAHPEVIKTLIANGCDAHFINRAEENLIHQVIKKYVRTYDKGLQYLQMLFDEGLDVDKPNVVGKTPLYQAVEFHKNEYIEWLLENGADPNLADQKGVSPFFFALGNQADHDKYVIMRKYATPDFDRATNDGETLLFECIRMGSHKKLELIKMLLEDGADLDRKSNHYGEQTSWNLIATGGVDLLQLVNEMGQLDVNRKDDQGNTLLHKVCAHDSNHSDGAAKETYRKVKLLLENGADVNATNDADETPMILASKDNLKTKTVELLLKSK